MPAMVSAQGGGAVLDGVLERVTFANPETGYTIARIAPVKGEGEAGGGAPRESIPTSPSRGVSACLKVNSMGRGSNLRPSALALLRSDSMASSCFLACSRYPMVL